MDPRRLWHFFKEAGKPEEIWQLYDTFECNALYYCAGLNLPFTLWQINYPCAERKKKTEYVPLLSQQSFLPLTKWLRDKNKHFNNSASFHTIHLSSTRDDLHWCTDLLNIPGCKRESASIVCFFFLWSCLGYMQGRTHSLGSFLWCKGRKQNSITQFCL